MAFSELIKSFDKLRDYMRDFFVYGNKTRADFAGKSSRTYDNERRRIESYLGKYVKWEYGKGGKRVFLSVNSQRIPQNPFYQAYRSKSFTDNDILLHFFILDLLEDAPPMTVGEITDAISLRYGESFEEQTVRGKLREYTAAGILQAQKRGRALYYQKSSLDFAALFPNRVDAREFLAFFGEIAPFAVVGSYLADRVGLENPYLQFKHHFLMHTLEDTILLPLTEAMEENRLVEVMNFSGKSGAAGTVTGLPVAILTSVQTGRRYLILYGNKRRRFHSFRLDYIKKVKLLDSFPDADAALQKGAESMAVTWGASMSWRQETERFSMTLFVDEAREQYVLARLRRERRGGRLERIDRNKYRFTVECTDTNELMNWVKTFTGRILGVEGDNRQVIARFYQDMRRMEALYEEAR